MKETDWTSKQQEVGRVLCQWPAIGLCPIGANWKKAVELQMAARNNVVHVRRSLAIKPLGERSSWQK